MPLTGIAADRIVKGMDNAARGLATLICMGTGPATGSSLAGYFRDLTGSYSASIPFAPGALLISALVACTLTLSATPRYTNQTQWNKSHLGKNTLGYFKLFISFFSNSFINNLAGKKCIFLCSFKK